MLLHVSYIFVTCDVTKKTNMKLNKRVSYGVYYYNIIGYCLLGKYCHFGLSFLIQISIIFIIFKM